MAKANNHHHRATSSSSDISLYLDADNTFVPAASFQLGTSATKKDPRLPTVLTNKRSSSKLASSFFIFLQTMNHQTNNDGCQSTHGIQHNILKKRGPSACDHLMKFI